MNNDIKKPQPPKQILRAGIYAPVPTFEEAFKDSTKQRKLILILMMTLTKVIFDSIIHIIIQYRLYQKKINFSL